MATMDKLLVNKLLKLEYKATLLLQGHVPVHQVGNQKYRPPENRVQEQFSQSPTPEQVASALVQHIVNQVTHVQAEARTVYITVRPVELQELEEGDGVLAYTSVSILAL